MKSKLFAAFATYLGENVLVHYDQADQKYPFGKAKLTVSVMPITRNESIGRIDASMQPLGYDSVERVLTNIAAGKEDLLVTQLYKEVADMIDSMEKDLVS